MANHISDTELSNLKGKSTEQSREDSSPLETNRAYEQDNNTDLTQIKESPKAEALHCLQDTDQWATRQHLHTITEQLCKMTKTLRYINTSLAKVRRDTVSLKQSIFNHAVKHKCNHCRNPQNTTRDSRESKTSFNQNQQNKHSQRFNIQQTINPKSSHSKYEHSSSQSDTRHNDVQKQRLGKNQCSSSQTNPIFLQQHDVRSPEFQTNGSNSSQDSFHSKTSNKSTKTRRD